MENWRDLLASLCLNFMVIHHVRSKLKPATLHQLWLVSGSIELLA